MSQRQTHADQTRIGEDGDVGRRGGRWDQVIRLGPRRAAGREGTEFGGDQPLDGRGVEVTDGDERDAVGTIPRVVKGGELGARKMPDGFLRADDRAAHLAGFGEEEQEIGEAVARVGRVARGFLAQDDAALALDQLVGEGDLPGILAKHAQALVQRGLRGIG